MRNSALCWALLAAMPSLANGRGGGGGGGGSGGGGQACDASGLSAEYEESIEGAMRRIVSS